jgi:hypothetical protein
LTQQRVAQDEEPVRPITLLRGVIPGESRP